MEYVQDFKKISLCEKILHVAASVDVNIATLRVQIKDTIV
jgi:hypothetical protein